jgi:hypothetical protein
MAYLAMAYLTTSQTIEAVELLKGVVTVEETTHAEDHPNRLASQYALARAYEASSKGKITKATTVLFKRTQQNN